MFRSRFTFIISLFSLAVGGLCIPQGVSEVIRPAGASPDGCVETVREPFGISAVSHVGQGLQTACYGEDTLKMTLNYGVLTDSLGRIGSIVANRQFQFDGPPAQAGAIYTGGWSVCPDNTLAIGPQKVFYSCESGTCECFPASFFFFCGGGSGD